MSETPETPVMCKCGHAGASHTTFGICQECHCNGFVRPSAQPETPAPTRGLMRTKLCAELGTAHHGDWVTALNMIRAAAEAGCDAVKWQHYGAVNPSDPQASWLEASRLSLSNQALLRDDCRQRGMEAWATPFDAQCLSELVTLGVDRIKIASTQAHEPWWWKHDGPLMVSAPWGSWRDSGTRPMTWILTAIPLYPTPLEAVSQASLRDGWSDHVVGLSACYKAIVEGTQWIEAHLKLPGVTTRDRDWEKTPEDFRQLRQFAEDCETMRTGISQVFRDRWRV